MAVPTYLHSNPLIRWLFHRRHHAVASLIDVEEGGTALDFGCGIGAFLPTLREGGLQPFAIDLELAYAKRLNGLLDLDVEFAEKITDLPDCSVDVVVAADVLEHVEDLPGLVSQFVRVLRPGGALIISAPTENFAYKLGRIVAGFAGKGEYHHRDARDIEAAVSHSEGITRDRSISIPWSIPPHLFRVVRFVKDDDSARAR